MHIRRFGLEYLTAILSAVAVSLVVAFVFSERTDMCAIAAAALTVLFGPCVGSTIGVVLADRFIYGNRPAKPAHMTVSLVFGLSGSIAGIFAMDQYGNNMLLAVALVVPMLSLIGYHGLGFMSKMLSQKTTG